MQPTRIRITPTLVVMFVVGIFVAMTTLEAAEVLKELVRDPSGALVLALAVYVVVLAVTGWVLGRLARRLRV